MESVALMIARSAGSGTVPQESPFTFSRVLAQADAGLTKVPAERVRPGEMLDGQLAYDPEEYERLLREGLRAFHVVHSAAVGRNQT